MYEIYLITFQLICKQNRKLCSQSSVLVSHSPVSHAKEAIAVHYCYISHFFHEGAEEGVAVGGVGSVDNVVAIFRNVADVSSDHNNSITLCAASRFIN